MAGLIFIRVNLIINVWKEKIKKAAKRYVDERNASQLGYDKNEMKVPKNIKPTLPLFRALQHTE